MNKKTLVVVASVVVLSIALVYIIMKEGYFSAIHDIAVVSVMPSGTEVYVGDVINITVIVKNKGTQTETFNVTSFYDATVLETQTVIDLPAGAQTSLTFNWNTTDVTPANYWVKAEASVVPDETDTSDNTCLDGIIRLRAQQTERETLYVDPCLIKRKVGDNFTISVSISDVADLYGWEFKLRWDSTLLDCVDVDEGAFLKQGGNTFFITPTINKTEGYVLLDCMLLGEIPGVSDNGTLAVIEFHVKDTGECSLDLYDTKLLSSFEQLIKHVIKNGNFVPP